MRADSELLEAQRWIATESLAFRIAEFWRLKRGGDGHEQCEREAGDDGVIRRRGLRKGLKSKLRMAMAWASVDFDAGRAGI